MNRAIARVGLLFKSRDPRVREILPDLVPWLQSRGLQVIVDSESAPHYSGCESSPRVQLPLLVDILAVFGGDGTLLSAARLVAGEKTPILGINLGALGFLTEVKLEGVRPAFEALMSGQYALEKRILLRVEVSRQGKELETYLALNDGVINKGALARIIELEVRINSELVTLFKSDGLIIATPTGSTAYSLSAGGPVVYPSLGAFIITPICPHTLTNRPVVIPDEFIVEVTLRRGSDVMLTVDGQTGLSLKEEDSVKFQKATAAINLVQPTGNSTFFKVLREKLKWG